MKRLLVLPAVAVLCTAEVWRRGFIAPVLYGCRTWTAALRPPTTAHTEADLIG